MNRSGQAIGPRAGIRRSCMADVATLNRPVTAAAPGHNRPPVLEAVDLKKHFPVKKGILRKTVGQVYAVDGVTFTIGEGETLGMVGEVGLRQIHGRAHRVAPGRADRGVDQARRARRDTAGQGGAAALSPPDADDLPGPVLVSEPAHVGGRHRRRAAPGPPARGWQGTRADGRRHLRSGRSAPRPDEGVSARVFRRSAAAHLDRARARR